MCALHFSTSHVIIYHFSKEKKIKIEWVSVHIIFHCTWVRCKKEIIKTNTCVQELQLAARVFVLGCSHLPPFFCCCCYISLAFGGGTLHFHLERSLIENTFNRRRNIRRNRKIGPISVATGTSLSFTFQHPNSNKLTKKKLSLSYMNSPAHHQLNLFYHMFAYFSLFFLFPHHVFDWLCFRLLRRFCHTLKNKKTPPNSSPNHAIAIAIHVCDPPTNPNPGTWTWISIDAILAAAGRCQYYRAEGCQGDDHARQQGRPADDRRERSVRAPAGRRAAVSWSF